ncbi:MAG: hypothetical protein PHE77_02035 [Candidatus Pacebacteria bacterium]|nr:hypothetical protein [Candidatus Paceibacterota bacterium]
MKKITKKILSISLLILLGSVGRIFFVEFVKIPNFEIVSSLALLSGFYLGGIFSFITPLAIIFLSDLFIGNSAILLFTWSAFGIIGLLGIILRKTAWKEGNSFPQGRSFPPSSSFVLQAPIFGVLASCFFFIYTNFGWWVLSGMYPHTLPGLVACYINGLPFFKTNLLGNLILVPLVFITFLEIKNLTQFTRSRIFCKIKRYDFIRQRH